MRGSPSSSCPRPSIVSSALPTRPVQQRLASPTSTLKPMATQPSMVSGRKKKSATTRVASSTSASAVNPQAESRRKKYRARQQLLSERKKFHEEALQLDVMALRQEIANLATTKKLLQARTFYYRMGSLTQLLQQYFVLFQHGLDNHSAVQTEYLQANMEQDLRYGPYRGLEAFINQWTCYTNFHQGVQLSLPTFSLLEDLDEPIVACSATLTARLSRATIENVFPHLLRHEELVQLLIGKQLTYHCEYRFLFNAQNKVFGLDIEVNFVQAVMQLVDGDMHLAAYVLQDARIEGVGYLGQKVNRQQQLQEPQHQQHEELATQLDALHADNNNKLCVRFLLNL